MRCQCTCYQHYCCIIDTGSFLAPPLDIANHSSSTQPSLSSSQRPPTLPHSPKVTTSTQYRSYVLNPTPSGVVSPNYRSFLALWRNLTDRRSSLSFISLCPQSPLQLTAHSRSILPSVLAKFQSIVHTRICSARCQPSIRNPYMLQASPDHVLKHWVHCSPAIPRDSNRPCTGHTCFGPGHVLKHWAHSARSAQSSDMLGQLLVAMKCETESTS